MRLLLPGIRIRRRKTVRWSNGSVAGNDGDVDNGAVLTYSLNEDVAGLSLAPDGSYAFDPSHETYQSLAEGEVIDVVANYTVTDEYGASDQSTLTISVTGKNDLPVASEDTDSATEDGPVVNGSVAVNDSDADNGAVLTYSLDEDVAGLSLDPDGSYAFDPSHDDYQSLAEGEVIDVVANYTVTDEYGASDQSTLTITVTGGNDLPVAAEDTDSATEDGTVVNGSVAGNDGDVDNGAVLTYSLNEEVAGLSLDPDGSYAFDPTGDPSSPLPMGR